MSAKVISQINNKGGVAKTTSTVVIAEILACIGCRVLVVDLDEQSNLSMAFHAYEEDSEDIITGQSQPERQNICELFKYRYKERSEVQAVIQHTYIPGIDIIPSSKRHGRTVLELTLNTGNNNIILKRAIRTIKDDYDYILIDNAPASNILTVNSIFASDYILTPVKVEQYSLKGLKETLSNIVYIKEEYDLDDITFLGAFISQSDHTNAYKSGRELFENHLQKMMLQTAIRRDTKINEVNQKLESLLRIQSNALADYAALLLELGILDAEETMRIKDCLGMD